jgi:hypothetical protein
MNRFVRAVVLGLGAILALSGCATMPQITKGSANYLTKGAVSARFVGNEFYMVIGEVDLYHYNMWGNLKPTGQTVEIATAVQADKSTGEILRIATMQARDADGVAVSDGRNYVLGDLRGGISVIDVQPFPRWLDAIQGMRNAITQLDTYTRFSSSRDENVPVVVAVTPGWGWWSWGGSWRQPWYPRYRHWR